jgi:hypothetical protein
MKIYNNLKGAVVAMLTIGLFSFSTVTIAQVSPPQQQQQTKTNFSDTELKQFIDANKRLMVIQQEGEKAMLSILQEEKLDIDTFNKMAMAHQQQKLNETGATAEEMASFNKAAERMMALQPDMQKKAEAAILKDGMKIELYEQIMLAYQQNPATQEKVNKLMSNQKK